MSHSQASSPAAQQHTFTPHRFGATQYFLAMVAVVGILLGLCRNSRAGDVKYVYDELGRLVQVIDASSGSSATYHYDAVGNLLSITTGSSSPGSSVSISQISPDSGPVGTQVTISGSGFSATASLDSVSFNGTAATISSASANTIVTTVPAGATTGPVTVSSPSGSATSLESFSVAVAAPQPPTIIGFTPESGTAGTSVSITGTNFATSSQDNSVTINGSVSQVTAATSTSLTIQVPADATSGPIAVTTQSGQATSSADFYVPPAGTTPGTTARISIGSSTSGSTTAANQAIIFLFSGTQGRWASFSFSNATFSANYTVLSPHDEIIANGSISNGGAFYDGVELPETGTYSVVIQPDTSTGSVTVTVNEATPIEENITIGGSVSINPINAGQDAYLSFNANAGQVVSLNWWYNLNCPSAAIVAPNGEVVASGSYCGSSNFIDATQLPVTGTYFIYLDTGAGGGNISFRLNDATPIHGTISVGTPVSETLNAGQDVYLTFTATANQQVSLNWYNSTLDCPNVKILDPSNNVVSYASYCGSSSFIDVQTLSAPGIYTVFVDTNDAPGSITVRLNDATSQNQPISIGGSPVTLNLNAGQDAYLSFAGIANQQVSLNWYNSNLNCPNVEILDPSNNVLGWASYCSSSDFMDAITLPTTGTYTVFVDTGPSAGTITVQLNDASSINGSISVGGSQSFTNLNPGQDVYLAFTGTAGQQVSLNWWNSTLDCPAVFIQNSSHSNMAGGGWCGSSSFIDVVTLPSAGTYYVFVDTGDRGGGISVALNNATTVTGTITPNGSSVTETNLNPGQDVYLSFSGTQGQTVTPSWSGSTLDCPAVGLLRPDGSRQAFAGWCGSSSSLGSQTLGTTGTYQIFVDTGDRGGNITLTLTSP